jgi:hypothetical protein
MRHKGYLEKWISWIRVVLTSGSSSILLNEVPGKQFKCKRWVRQGDPLSPFVFGTDLLQSVRNVEVLLGNLTHTLGLGFRGGGGLSNYQV